MIEIILFLLGASGIGAAISAYLGYRNRVMPILESRISTQKAVERAAIPPEIRAELDQTPEEAWDTLYQRALKEARPPSKAIVLYNRLDIRNRRA